MKNSLCIRKLVLASIWFLSILLISCNGCNDKDSRERLYEAKFGFELLDGRSSRNIFTTSAYSVDSVRLLNSNNRLRKIKSGIDAYAFSIDTIYNSTQNSIGQRVEKTFYLYLNRLDTDTIRVSFLPIDGKCDPYFTNYQVYYNQRLVATDENTISFFAKINKL